VRLAPPGRVWIFVALADTSDGFYSVRSLQISSREDRDSEETDRAFPVSVPVEFSAFALRRRDAVTEWIDTKPRSFDTDTRD